MRFDRAMTLLLEGKTIRRTSWVAQDRDAAMKASMGTEVLLRKEIFTADRHAGFSGEVARFGRVQGFGKTMLLTSDDIMADDWELADVGASFDEASSLDEERMDHALSRVAEAQIAAWPHGCIKRSSCARHMGCMYGFNGSCPHSTRNIVSEVAAFT